MSKIKDYITREASSITGDEYAVITDTTEEITYKINLSDYIGGVDAVETTVTGVANEFEIDFDAGDIFIIEAAAGNASVTFTNAPSQNSDIITCILLNFGNGVVTWPTNISWQDGTAPTLTDGGYDFISFISTSGGTIFGIIGSLNTSVVV